MTDKRLQHKEKKKSDKLTKSIFYVKKKKKGKTKQNEKCRNCDKINKRRRERMSEEVK